MDNINEYVNKMKKAHALLLDFLEKEEYLDEDYDNLIKLYDELNFKSKKEYLEEFLILISTISKNHHHNRTFYTKIIKILDKYEQDISRNFTSHEIFQIFKNSKRILLYFIEKKMIIITKDIADVMLNPKHIKFYYDSYFYPELKDFVKQKPDIKYIDRFEELRQIGENEDEACKIIRSDSVKDFEDFVKRSNKSSVQNIFFPLTIYETSWAILRKGAWLTDYAAYSGSFNIFNYLVSQNAGLKQDLWIFAIHGNNIQILERLKQTIMKPYADTRMRSLIESYKCHHIKVTDFVWKNYFQKVKKKSDVDFDVDVDDVEEEDYDDFDNGLFNRFVYAFKYHNYSCFPKNLNKAAFFYDLCQFNYVRIVELFLQSNDFKFDVNVRVISNLFF